MYSSINDLFRAILYQDELFHLKSILVLVLDYKFSKVSAYFSPFFSTLLSKNLYKHLKKRSKEYSWDLHQTSKSIHLLINQYPFLSADKGYH